MSGHSLLVRKGQVYIKEEELIEAIKEQPCIWDVNSPDYKFPEMKDNAWKEVTKRVGVDNVSIVKYKWKMLRDVFREAVKKNINRSEGGRPLSKFKTWKHYKRMEFILPFMSLRCDKGKINLEVLEAGQMDAIIEDNITVEETPIVFDDNEEVSIQFDENDNGDDDNDTMSDFDDVKPIPKKRLKIEHLSLPAVVAPEKYERVERDINQQRDNPLTMDSLYYFFLSMYESTQNLPDSYKTKVKRKIFEIVMNAEEEVNKSNLYQ